MTHSPDHAERARVEAIIRNEVGDACYDDVRWLSNREVTERCVVAALRDRDAKEAGEQGCGEGRDG